jgi:hypothetical protein
MAVSGFTVGILTLTNNPTAALAQGKTQHQSHKTHVTRLSQTALASFASPVALTISNPIPAPAVTPVTTPVTTPPPAPTPVITVAAPTAAPSLSDATSVDTADWQCIRIHESGDQYNNPSAPSGAYGILVSTWHDFGYSGWPYQAAPAVQDQLALRLYSMYGFHPWSSRYACGL